jgi:hypothetical protein
LANAQVHAQVVLLFSVSTRTLRADLWSIRGTIHLENDDSWTNPLWRAGYGRTRETLFGGFRIKLRGHPASCVPVLAKLENPKVASFGMATLLCTVYEIRLRNLTYAAAQPSRANRNRAEKLLSRHQGHPGHPPIRSGV